MKKLLCIICLLTIVGGVGCLEDEDEYKVSKKKYSPPAAKIVSSNWRKDPSGRYEYGIEWNVQVENISSKYIREAKVEFTTYEAGGQLVATDFTFVSAIPPGESRASKAHTHLYGTEVRVSFKLAKVYFAR